MEKYFTVQEIARNLDVSEQSVRNFVKQGKLQKVKVGRNVRISTTALDKFLQGGGETK